MVCQICNASCPSGVMFCDTCKFILQQSVASTGRAMVEEKKANRKAPRAQKKSNSRQRMRAEMDYYDLSGDSCSDCSSESESDCSDCCSGCDDSDCEDCFSDCTSSDDDSDCEGGYCRPKGKKGKKGKKSGSAAASSERCQGTIKSGPNKGMQCQNDSVGRSLYCGQHKRKYVKSGKYVGRSRKTKATKSKKTGTYAKKTSGKTKKYHH